MQYYEYNKKLQFYFVYGSLRRMFRTVRVSQLSLPTFTLTIES